MTTISPAGDTTLLRTCRMHRIRVSTVVALVLGVVLTLVVALQMLPVSRGADTALPAVGAGGDAVLSPVAVFIVCAAFVVLASAATLVSSTKDERGSN